MALDARCCSWSLPASRRRPLVVAIRIRHEALGEFWDDRLGDGEVELRFAHGWLAFLGSERVKLGLAAFVDGDVNEVLVTWLTDPCGPRAAIDIGQDVSAEGKDPAATKITERTRSCDSAGMEATVALRFRGPWTDVENIEGTIVYHSRLCAVEWRHRGLACVARDHGRVGAAPHERSPVTCRSRRALAHTPRGWAIGAVRGQHGVFGSLTLRAGD